jgi:hypothetical protein
LVLHQSLSPGESLASFSKGSGLGSFETRPAWDGVFGGGGAVFLRGLLQKAAGRGGESADAFKQVGIFGALGQVTAEIEQGCVGDSVGFQEFGLDPILIPGGVWRDLSRREGQSQEGIFVSGVAAKIGLQGGAAACQGESLLLAGKQRIQRALAASEVSKTVAADGNQPTEPQVEAGLEELGDGRLALDQFGGFFFSVGP